MVDVSNTPHTDTKNEASWLATQHRGLAANSIKQRMIVSANAAKRSGVGKGFTKALAVAVLLSGTAAYADDTPSSVKNGAVAPSSKADTQTADTQAAGQVAKPSPAAQPATAARGIADLAAAHGIYFRAFLDEEIASNPMGGIHHGATASQYAAYGGDVDLQKLVGWKGGIFHMTIISENSTGESAKYIGGGIDAQENYAPFNLTRFLNLTLEQNLSLFHKNDVNLIAGRMGAFPSFAKSVYACTFMNHVFCGNLYGFSQDTGTALAPLSTWGGRVRYNFTPKMYAQFGGFAIDGGTLLQNTHLTNFSNSRVTGTNWMGEVGYETTFANDAMPRSYRIGSWYLDAPRNDVFLNSRGQNYFQYGGTRLRHRGETGFYATADQVIYRPDSSTRNIAAFGSVFYNGDGGEAVKYALKAGLVKTGTFAGRDRDTVGFAVSDTAFSSNEVDYLNYEQRKGGGPGDVASKEYIFELNYGYVVAPGVILRPDLQYIMNPDPRYTPTYAKKIQNAVVVGLMVTINLDTLLGLPHLGS